MSMKAVHAGRQRNALHNCLVSSVFLQIEEESVETESPECRCTEIELRAAERHLVICDYQVQHLAGWDVTTEKQNPDGDDDPAPQDKTLQDIRPDHSFQPSDQGVEDGDDAEHENDAADGPACNATYRERQEIEHKAHLGKMTYGKGE